MRLGIQSLKRSHAYTVRARSLNSNGMPPRVNQKPKTTLKWHNQFKRNRNFKWETLCIDLGGRNFFMGQMYY